ncbi:MAG: helix-turn-helix transcriptional regulator [Bacteroidota bacterium]|nr:helix-turn-helix transcriptional regulator [Bacteroidota bacterium]MDP4212622.1 helix-turn-helix transcriptional regulator [Bacteroidota bacterium]MDP4248672.1 helix-turn-helix transcriptional regulator [Bacteroidota bacterium]
MLPVLTSGISGNIALCPDKNPGFPVLAGWDYYTGGNNYPVKLQLCSNNFIQVELYAIHPKRSEQIRFSDIMYPGLVISVFGKSCYVKYSSREKLLFHDRSCHLVRNAPDDYFVEFPVDGQYLISFIRYANDFALSLDTKLFGMTVRRPVILNREGMELLSALHFDPQYIDMSDFIREEILRFLITWYFNRATAGFLQPSHISPEEAETFYDEKNILLESANHRLPVQELLRSAGIRNIYLFRKRLRQFYGLNIRAFLTEAKLLKAVTLLKDQEFSIKQIASMAGFVNVSYFTRVFTLYFHEPPGKFQKS